MAAQAPPAAQQAPQQQALYPPPPPFYRLYRPGADGSVDAPLPPPPVEGAYQQFGIADSVGGCILQGLLGFNADMRRRWLAGRQD